MRLAKLLCMLFVVLSILSCNNRRSTSDGTSTTTLSRWHECDNKTLLSIVETELHNLRMEKDDLSTPEGHAKWEEKIRIIDYLRTRIQ